jgi:glycosyltransferase involved in cell wall biosynthesis
MKILVAHNYYKLRGGEDVVFESEVDLLAGGGHEVRTLKLFNDDVKSISARAAALLGTAHNHRGIEVALRAIEEFHPDVIHFHNVFPLLSPAVYSACRHAGVAVVQTLHNFRPICLGSLLLRDGQVCQLCMNGSSVPGILHRCYRDSFVASAAAARMVSVHRQRGTWRSDVDRYITLTNFGRNKFIEAGFPAGLIEVKPNFMADPARPAPDRSRSGVLYVGRLSPEKGVSTLIQACREANCTLRVVGTGPDLPALKAQAGDKVRFLGALDRASVLEEMAQARVVVAPSIWFEGFPMVLVEAFACGTPVIASRLGALAEIVEDGVTGALVPPNDPAQLGQKLALFLSDPDLTTRLGGAARRAFLERYTPAVSLGRLEDIYRSAMEQFGAGCRRISHPV